MSSKLACTAAAEPSAETSVPTYASFENARCRTSSAPAMSAGGVSITRSTSMPSAVPRIAFTCGAARLWRSAGFAPGMRRMRSVTSASLVKNAGVKTWPSCGKSPTTTRFLSPKMRCTSFSVWMNG